MIDFLASSELADVFSTSQSLNYYSTLEEQDDSYCGKMIRQFDDELTTRLYCSNKHPRRRVSKRAKQVCEQLFSTPHVA